MPVEEQMFSSFQVFINICTGFKIKQTLHVKDRILQESVYKYRYSTVESGLLIVYWGNPAITFLGEKNNIWKHDFELKKASLLKQVSEGCGWKNDD